MRGNCCLAPALIVIAGGLLSLRSNAQCAWEDGPTFPGGPRKGAAGLNHAGTLLAIGGRPWNGQGASVNYLTPGSPTWQAGVPLESLVMHPAAAVDSFGRIVVAGGYLIEDHYPWFTPMTATFLYDVSDGTQDALASLTYARGTFAFTTDANGRLYVIGGLNVDRVPTPYVERYDAVNDAWEILANLPEPRDSATAVYDGAGHILVMGGISLAGSRTNTVFSYDVADGTWSTVDPQPVALSGQAAVLGANGLVYVVGGTTGSGETAAVYVFDPIDGQWSIGPALTTARSGAAIARSDDGWIYAMGGYAGTLGTDTVERLNTLPPDTAHDCNGNAVPDECDIAGGFSADLNANGIPDECEVWIGDLNCDGSVDLGDINPFVLRLSNPTQYFDQFIGCPDANGDINVDGVVNLADINPFVMLLTRD